MSIRDIRTMNMSEGQKVESDNVMKRIGDLAYRNLGALSKISMFDQGKALIVGDGLRVEPSSGMTVSVPSGAVFQRFTDVIPCLQIASQTVTLDAATGVARTDIIEAQIKSVSNKDDISQVATVASGSAIAITNETIKRDIKYYLSARKQTGTTTPTSAVAGVLTGTVAIAGTIDLSGRYLLNLADGEDGSFQEIDCRGATPGATSRIEIINAINAAVGRTMASTGAGNVIVLTGIGTGETSFFSIQPPATDPDKDCLNAILGLSIGGIYRYNYSGTNEWFKLAEIDVGTSTTVITSGLIRNVNKKTTWSDGGNNVLLDDVQFPGYSFVKQDTTTAIDLYNYFNDVVIYSNPSSDITLTISNYLPEGKKFEIVNKSNSSAITLNINSKSYTISPQENKISISDGSAMFVVGQDAFVSSEINNLEISNNSTDPDHDIDIAAGSCFDSTKTILLELTSGLTKKLDEPWAVGDNAGGRISESDDPYGLNGSSSVFESATTNEPSIAILSATQAIVAYVDADNSNYGTAVILDISGSIITPGTPQVFYSGTTSGPSITRLSDTKALVCYDTGSAGVSVILDVSGSSISVGTPTTFESADISACMVTPLTSSKAIVCYADSGNSAKGTACILDISGSAITAGTPLMFRSKTILGNDVIRLTDTKAMWSGLNLTDAQVDACILDVSGSTITNGAILQVDTGGTHSGLGFISSTRAICVFDGEAILLDVAGSTLSKVGSKVSLGTATHYYYGRVHRNSSTSFLAPFLAASPGALSFVEIGVSGDIITARASVQVESSNVGISGFNISREFNGGSSPIIVYHDADNSYYGTSQLLGTDVLSANFGYYPFLAMKDSDGSMDVFFSSNALSPSAPAGYTYYRRLRGIVLTDSTANIVGFTQYEDRFEFNERIIEFTTTSPANTKTDIANLTLPDVTIIALFHLRIRDSSVSYVNVYGDNQIDRVVTQDESDFVTEGGNQGAWEFERIITDKTVSYKSSNTAMDDFSFSTRGFIDKATI
jgi:hypothetical protein